MNNIKDGKIKAASTYNSASDHFNDYPLSFWDFHGRKTIEHLSLNKGDIVLDVGCGAGASAIPAAEVVGEDGKVIGIDLAEKLLEYGQKKAAKKNLKNIEFRVGDMEKLEDYFPDNNKFNAVVCVFAIFFVNDMESQIRKLWKFVRPKGGKLAITTWGPRFFEPAYSHWNNILRSERPDLYSAFNPWDRITDGKSVQRLMQNGGTTNVDIIEEHTVQPLNTPDDWWIIALGTGLRWTIDQFGPSTFQKIKQDNIQWVKENNIKAIETNAIYAIATKD